MQTSAFITYMADFLSTAYSRAAILDMTNNAQNEILSHPNELTRITPDPYLHTGMTAIAGGAGNSSGDADFVVGSAIPTTVPTAGYLLVTESSTTTKYKYVSYTSATFTLADGVTLTSTYTTAASCTIDNFDILASGALFSSVANSRTTQWDVRSVSKIYSYRDSSYMTRQYGREVKTSYNPDIIPNYNGNIIEQRVDCIESVEPASKDCRLIWWRENDPGITTAIYAASAQRWPTQVSAESVALTIPDRFQREVLKWGILRNAEYKAYGRDDRPEDKYKRSLAEFLASVSHKASVKRSQVTPRF